MFVFQREEIIERFYDLPWYNLPPKQRRLYLTILCQVQQPVTFTAFKVFIVNLSMFPRLLNAAYSYLNVIRQIQK